MAIDVAEDQFRYPHLTHVVIVAGDSDYVALAQRCKQLGRYVIGIGVRGSTSSALVSACNEFKHCDTLPGVAKLAAAAPVSRAPKAAKEEPPKQTEADLLVEALELAQSKGEEWQSLAGIKSQMMWLDPTFDEGSLGFKTFTVFVQSLAELVELDGGTSNRKVRLKPKP